MKYESFTVTVDAGVAHLVLSRPDAYNTMIPSFWRDLPAAVDELDRGGEVRVLVVSSTGKHFSAGMDLAVFTSGDLVPSTGVSEVGRRNANLSLLVRRLQESFSCFERARFPVLCAVHGGCIGGAIDMITAADCRYATEDAFFVVQEINLGMTADVGTLQRLPRLIPEGVAREWAYTGDRVPAARAQAVGLVNAVYADQETMVDDVLAIARRIAAKSPLAVWGTKEMVNFARDHTTADALRHIATWQAGMFQPGDMMECFTAKSEGRDPLFEDLGPRP